MNIELGGYAGKKEVSAGQRIEELKRTCLA